VTVEYSVNAYENNQVNLYAVQGESDSRTIIFNIIEKSGIVAATSNATPINKMLDLTGYDVTLTVLNSEESVVSGEILDAENGKVQFTLSKACSAEQGNFKCVIILTKNSEDLRIVGITLAVAGLAAKNTITIYRNSVWSDIVQIENQSELYTLGTNEKLIFVVREGEKIIIKKELIDSDYVEDENGYLLSLSSAETDIGVGTYSYKLTLQRADGEYEPVIPLHTFIIKE